MGVLIPSLTWVSLSLHVDTLNTYHIIIITLLLLHASWKFLFPVLSWDPRPLKFQFLLNVKLLALFKKCRILVAVGRQKV